MNLTGPNQFTPAVLKAANVAFDLVVRGTFQAVVTLSISKDQNTWIDLEAFTGRTIQVGSLGTQWYVRAGIKPGHFVSGTAEVEVY